jgi:hypothetical protein
MTYLGCRVSLVILHKLYDVNSVVLSLAYVIRVLWAGTQKILNFSINTLLPFNFSPNTLNVALSSMHQRQLRHKVSAACEWEPGFRVFVYELRLQEFERVSHNKIKP